MIWERYCRLRQEMIEENRRASMPNLQGNPVSINTQPVCLSASTPNLRAKDWATPMSPASPRRQNRFSVHRPQLASHSDENVSITLSLPRPASSTQCPASPESNSEIEQLKKHHKREVEQLQKLLRQSNSEKKDLEEQIRILKEEKNRLASEMKLMSCQQQGQSEKATILRYKVEKELEQLRLENTKSKKFKEILLLTRKVKDLRCAKDFKIIRKLGGGSSGIVFLAEVSLPNTSRPLHFALKMVCNYQRLSTKEINTYKNEFEILSNLPDIHPNIIHILSEFVCEPTQEMIDYAHESVQDLFTFTNPKTGEVKIYKTQFFLTEYHPITLKDEFQSSSLTDVHKIYRYSRDLLDCFAFLFENRIVHRDVKMDNILVSSDNHLIVSDFGESVKTDDNYCCNREDLNAGNMLYQSPEVINGINPSNHLPINFRKQYSWEVGCLIYELIAGEHPFGDYPKDDAFGKPPNFRVGKVRFNFPAFNIFPDDFKNLISSLLENDAGKRKGIKEALADFDRMNLL